jgi:hypothetical protein
MNDYYFILERLYDVSILTFVIPAILAVLRWKFFNFTLRIIAVNTFRALVISSGALIFYYTHYSNRVFYYASPCLDIILLSLVAASFFQNKKINIGLSGICAVFISLMIYDYFNSESMISTYLTSFETVYVIIILLVLLRKIILTFRSGTYKKSLIWLLVALLISNLFSMLVISFNQIVLDYSSELLRFSWYLSSPTIIIITNLMTSYGFFIVKHPVKSRL